MSAYSDLILGRSGLQSYWRLNDGSRSPSSAVDAKGAQNGNYTGAPTCFKDRAGDGGFARLQGGSPGGYIDVADIYDFSARAAYSAEGWVNRDSTISAGVACAIASKYGTGGSSQLGWFVGLDVNGKPYCGRYDSADASDGLNSASAVSNNAWHHIAYTYDGSTMRLYVDGAEDPASPVASTRNQVDSTVHLLLGKFSGISGTMKGEIRDVAIYDRALTAAEVAAGYALGISGGAIVPSSGQVWPRGGLVR